MAFAKTRDVLGRIGAGLWILLGKLGVKFLSVGIKLFKVFKVGKVGLAGASLFTYAYLWSWKFAILIVGSLVIHEYGHILAMKHYGMATKGIYLIPFVGGAAVTESEFPSRTAEVVIALAGPCFGLALAMVAGLWYLETGSPFFAAAASWIAMMNLFNLLPINPLDGGRVAKSLVFSINETAGLVYLGLGAVLAGFLAWKMKMGLLVVLMVVGLAEAWGQQRGRKRLLAKYDDACEAARWECNNDMFFFPSYVHQERLVATLGSLKKTLTTALGSMSRLSGRGFVVTVLAYAALTFVLWGIMALCKAVPGAELAKQFLEG